MQALVVGLEEFLEDDAGGQAVIYEMLSASRHSDEIRAELAELYRQWRERLAGWLRTKEREGVIRLQAEPEAVASILFSLGDGFGIQVLSDPDWDQQAAFELGVATAPAAARRFGVIAASQSSTAAATASRSLRRLWSPFTWTTSRFGPGSGIPKRSLSPCTTSIGTRTASSSGWRLGDGSLPARAGGWSGNARHSTAAAPVASAVRHATRAPGRAAAGDQRQAVEVGRHQVLDHRDPRGVELLRRR